MILSTFRPRRNKLSVLTVFLSVCLCAFPAFAKKPTVKVLRVKDQIVYKSVPDGQTNCDKDGSVHLVGIEKAGGCTSPENFVYKVNVNCDKKEISFSFGYSKYLVEIVNRYKKGTIVFDQILKHESTHVRIYQKTAEKFYKPMGQAFLMQYEKSEREGKSCPEIRNNINRLYKNYFYKYVQETDKQNSLIDGRENYDYQMRNVLKQKLFLTPRVKVSEKKTEYVSFPAFNADIGYRRTFDINGDVPFFSLELMPVVYRPSDYPKDDCRFNAGMKYAEDLLERKREAFRIIEEELKWFLPDAFKKASQTQKEYADIQREGLKIADQRISDRLKEADSEFTDRQAVFAECERFERKQREAEPIASEEPQEAEPVASEEYISEPEEQPDAGQEEAPQTDEHRNPSPDTDETTAALQAFPDKTFDVPRQTDPDEEKEEDERPEKYGRIREVRFSNNGQNVMIPDVSSVVNGEKRGGDATKRDFEHYSGEAKEFFANVAEEFELKEKFDGLIKKVKAVFTDGISHKEGKEEGGK